MTPTPTADASPGPVTAEQWREAADRAFRPDRALLADAYAAIELTDDIRKLLAAAIWRLDRDHILTLAGLPARLAASSAAGRYGRPARRGSATADLGRRRWPGGGAVIAHLDPAVVDQCRQLGDTDLIDHATAKKIAHAYQWGWATCWFAGEGEIGHAILTGRWCTDPDATMAYALFGWRQRSRSNPRGHVPGPGEQAVIAAMTRYLTARVDAGDTGPVPGWPDLPRR